MSAIASVIMKNVFRLNTLLQIGALSCLGAAALSAPLSAYGQLLKPSVPASKLSPSKPPRIVQSLANPPVPPLPSPLPTVTSPISDGIVGLYPETSDEIGVGHLRPRDLSFLDDSDWTNSPYLGANWLRAAAIPIYVEPDGQHWGWIMSGWLVPNGQEGLVLGRDASFSMLHTYYDLFSFPVTQIREDGWFQFQYTPAGRAWAHVSHLDLGRLDLAVESWQNRFIEMGLVEFRDHGISKPLLSQPGDEAGNTLGLIGQDSFIEPLAFDGDWMQVRVTQPADGCTIEAGAATQEGWVRWRDEEGTSLIWYPPKGC